MIDGVSAEAPSETFMAVARAIFDDGQFNWGRVVMLFYLAYKLAKKVGISGYYNKEVKSSSSERIALILWS